MAETVTLTIDGKSVTVPKGTNLIDAAKAAGVTVPYYCWHPHLSIAGNCRMCQMQVEGQPKLTIGCNTSAAEGMKVHTHESSTVVADAQRATLEFLLINHPLDCTVCDQAGHCKLQDYYYEYNQKPSRFIEEKNHKVKAEVLGPEVIYDGERCIVCTRCSRFCEEIPGTGELGVFNRGDRSVIGVYPGKELNNPFSGTVVDLCPVGALTHRRWRFNTRIWYTNQQDTICTGCSTGCNVKVAVRDGQVVHVKARLNSVVNQEWLCDEGRYGFERFQPESRLTKSYVRADGELREAPLEKAMTSAAALAGSTKEDAAIFISPFLSLEEMWSTVQFAEKVMGVPLGSGRIALPMRLRDLTPVQAKLISPDYAPNARGAAILGLIDPQLADWRKILQAQYQNLLNLIRKEGVKRVLLVGDFALNTEDVDAELVSALRSANCVVTISPRMPDSPTSISALSTVLLPGRTVHEKSGVMVNRNARFQRLKSLLTAPFGANPEWMLLAKIAQLAKKPIFGSDVTDERSLFRVMVGSVPSLKGLTLMKIGELGITLDELKQVEAVGSPAQASV